MKKFKLGKDILILIVITLITVLSWISFEVWLIANKTTINKVTQEQMASLNPNINNKIIDSLKNKLNLSTEEIDQLIKMSVATQSSEKDTSQNEELATESGQAATGSSKTATESSQTSTESAINN